MARERELTGIVRPSVDERSLGRVGDQLSETFDSAANLTPDLNLSRARRKLRSLTPGSIGGGLSGGLAAGGAVGAPDDDVQDKQLNELQRIRRTLSKQALTDPGGGGPGVGTGALLGRAAGAGSSGVLAGGLLGGGLLVAAGLLAAGDDEARALGSETGTAGGPVTESGPPGSGPIDPTETGVPIGELPEAIRNFEWPDLPDLPAPLQDFDWPSLPDLPNLSALEWPAMPDPPNLAALEWPDLQEPPWVRDLLSVADGRRGRDAVGAGDRINRNQPLEGGDARLLTQAQQGGGTAQFQFDVQAVIEDLDRQLDRFKQDVTREVEQELSRKLVD